MQFRFGSSSLSRCKLLCGFALLVAQAIACTQVEDDKILQPEGYPDTILESTPSKQSGFPIADFTFSSTKRGSTFECAIGDDEDSLVYVSCSSPYQSAALASGGHLFAVRAIDNEGKVDPSPAKYSWEIDTSVADFKILQKPPAKNNTPVGTISFVSNQVVANFTCSVQGSNVTAGCERKDDFSGTLTMPAQPDGGYEISITAQLQAGTSLSDNASWRLDTTKPVVEIGGDSLQDAGVNFTFSITEANALADPAAQCRTKPDNMLRPCDASGIATTMTGGSHSLVVVVYDEFGNQSAETTVQFQVDDVKPTFSNFDLSPPDAVYLASAENGTVICQGSSPNPTSCLPANSGPPSLVVVVARNSCQAIYAFVRDAVGNQSDTIQKFVRQSYSPADPEIFEPEYNNIEFVDSCN